MPREFYLGKLVAMRNHLLAVSLGVMLLLVAAGIAILRSVKARAGTDHTRKPENECIRIFSGPDQTPHSVT